MVKQPASSDPSQPTFALFLLLPSRSLLLQVESLTLKNLTGELFEKLKLEMVLALFRPIKKEDTIIVCLR